MGSFIQRWGSTWGKNVLVAVSVAVLGGGAAGCGVVATDVSAHSQGDSSEPEGENNNSTPVVTEDGRMLKPDGYVGLWFETEPTDPWEHYVWLSQKYVGDPVHLGELGPGEAHDNFVGEPDICSDEVIARMKEIGFEGGPGPRAENIFACDFESLATGANIFGDQITLNYAPGIETDRFEEVAYSAEDGYGIRFVSLRDEEGPLHCVATVRPIGARFWGFISTNASENVPQADACKYSAMSKKILENIGIY